MLKKICELFLEKGVGELVGAKGFPDRSVNPNL